MILIINGQKKTFVTPLDLRGCLEQEGYGDMLVAVARNGTFVAKNNYGATKLDDGDEIEIVAPMQGG
ncbi:MAG: thiamine biosynthesis protein ThiS [Micavibrio sp.]|nr:MAG: thiamine biosynthesis protein ThiS [Micavibrio sp.]